MKPIAIFILVAAVSVFTVAATAKTVTSTQVNANEQSVAAVAGPVQAANNSGTALDKSKKAKKAKVVPKPPLQDPN